MPQSIFFNFDFIGSYVGTPVEARVILEENKLSHEEKKHTKGK